ncbi:hypothetical protein PV327_007411 [Microctonus hyperodae]|uniref:Thioredoxin domain-containing protein 17 n=1 Tax=Microctonus hyperodae TaxID=165561 RepID=A0AA39FZ43_MICHY|nr:hypothetical protein PV327_007411 [Microctonus hyperodae]
MITRHYIEGYENLLELIQNLKVNGPIVVLYSGSKLSNGKSWCSDCVEAAPFIERGLEFAPESAHFIHVEVGDRTFWKDHKCPFRTSPKTKLNVLPTLSLWGTQKRLEGAQCLDLGLFEMLFNEDEI